MFFSGSGWDHGWDSPLEAPGAFSLPDSNYQNCISDAFDRSSKRQMVKFAEDAWRTAAGRLSVSDVMASAPNSFVAFWLH